MPEVNELGRKELKQLRPNVFLPKHGFDQAQEAGSESAGNFATAACIALEDAEASPQEFLTIYEAIKQCLELNDSPDASTKLHQAVEEATSLTEGLLVKKLNYAITAWIQECLPFVKTENGITAFMEHLRMVAEQYSLTMSLKHRA
jgi:hypothetical protein